jgi:hypothetical protein
MITNSKEASSNQAGQTAVAIAAAGVLFNLLLGILTILDGRGLLGRVSRRVYCVVAVLSALTPVISIVCAVAATQPPTIMVLPFAVFVLALCMMFGAMIYERVFNILEDTSLSSMVVKVVQKELNVV